ncbi:phospholipid scramblase 3 isoform X2 [Folsomia candida]|uniref:phospholipid scramblase 3 isoform X2 n=1 Tax=Folsomia candida TaxID=158441 RepID=UPI000B8F0D20|nr:phospholipid scramblase 3 isoform X2 [Folsomia candida]
MSSDATHYYEGLQQDSDLSDRPVPPAEPQTSTTQELGYLNQVSEISIRQLPDVREMTRGTEEPNQYVIVEKSTGELLYKVIEDHAVCMQQICCSNRTFTLRLVDKFNREIIKIIRPHISCNWCCGLTDFYDKVEVWVRNFKSMRFDWRKFGYVKKFWCPLLPLFRVYEGEGDSQFAITGPVVTAGASTFTIKKSWTSTEPLGIIRKEWAGLCREFTSEYDVFSLKFPPDIDEKMKVILIGALFLIDYKFYEGAACL